MRQPDPQAFEQLFEQYKNLVYRTALLMLDDPGAAEEALQEVFVRVYRALASYDPHKGAPSTWLHRITVNYCLEQRRKHHFAWDDLDDESAAQSGDGVEASLSERASMAQAIACLSPKLRAVIVLRYFWDLPYAEIAQVLEVPLGTVKSRLDLALRTLRQAMEGEATADHAGLHDRLPAVREVRP